MSTNRKSQKRRKAIRLERGKICIICMVVALALIMGIQIARLYQRNQSYAQEMALLQAQLDEEQEYAEELEEEQAYVGTDEYVEDMARSRLGMVYEDEILFKEE